MILPWLISRKIFWDLIFKWILFTWLPTDLEGFVNMWPISTAFKEHLWSSCSFMQRKVLQPCKNILHLSNHYNKLVNKLEAFYHYCALQKMNIVSLLSPIGFSNYLRIQLEVNMHSRCTGNWFLIPRINHFVKSLWHRRADTETSKNLDIMMYIEILRKQTVWIFAITIHRLSFDNTAFFQHIFHELLVMSKCTDILRSWISQPARRFADWRIPSTGNGDLLFYSSCVDFAHKVTGICIKEESEEGLMATPSPKPRRFRALFGGSSSPEDEGSKSDGDETPQPTPLSVIAKHTRSTSERRRTPVGNVVKETLRPVLSDPYSLTNRWYVLLWNHTKSRISNLSYFLIFGSELCLKFIF